MEAAGEVPVPAEKAQALERCLEAAAFPLALKTS